MRRVVVSPPNECARASMPFVGFAEHDGHSALPIFAANQR